jgi:hypothetical protein
VNEEHDGPLAKRIERENGKHVDDVGRELYGRIWIEVDWEVGEVKIDRKAKASGAGYWQSTSVGVYGYGGDVHLGGNGSEDAKVNWRVA